MHQLFYITADPERALGVEDMIPSYHIIHSGKSQLDVPITNHGVDIKGFNTSETCSTAKLLEDNNLQNYIKSQQHGTPNILVFKPEKKIEEVCRRLGYKLINPDASILKRFENKLEFAGFLKNVGIFQKPEYIIFDKLCDATYENISKTIDDEVVVQFMFGHSGNCTFYINNEEKLEDLKKKFPLRRAKVARMIQGIPYTINACITRIGIVIGGISEQITGVESLTSSEGGTVGNDFTQRHLSEDLRREFIEKTVQFGELLKKEGHRGIFGLDVVLADDGELYLIEANTRQTMSCSYASYIQRLHQSVPIMLWHVLELIGQDYEEKFICLEAGAEDWVNKGIREFKSGEQISYNLKTNQPISASQIFFRNIHDHDIKISDPFPSGIYRIRGRNPSESADYEDNTEYPAIFRLREDGWSSLCFIKRGYNILEAQDEGGVIINVSAEGTVIPPLGEIGRIQTLGPAFSSSTSNRLNGWITDVLQAVYENMKVESSR